MKPTRYAVAATLILLPASAALGQQPVDLQGALHSQRALVESRPQDPAALNDLGNLLYLADDPKGAAEAYRTALDLDPDHVAARFNLALLKQQRGHCRQAQWNYRKTLKRDPEHAWSRFMMGVCFEKRRRVHRAIEHYARAFRLDPALSYPSNNPLLIESRLRSRALLKAFGSGDPASLVPRTYADPSRIAGLLLPQVMADEAHDEEREVESPPDEEEE